MTEIQHRVISLSTGKHGAGKKNGFGLVNGYEKYNLQNQKYKIS
jgi:hypothetical protein